MQRMITSSRAEFLSGINGYHVTWTRLGLFITRMHRRIPLRAIFRPTTPARQTFPTAPRKALLTDPAKHCISRNNLEPRTFGRRVVGRMPEPENGIEHVLPVSRCRVARRLFPHGEASRLSCPFAGAAISSLGSAPVLGGIFFAASASVESESSIRTSMPLTSGSMLCCPTSGSPNSWASWIRN